MGVLSDEGAEVVYASAEPIIECRRQRRRWFLFRLYPAGNLFVDLSRLWELVWLCACHSVGTYAAVRVVHGDGDSLLASSLRVSQAIVSVAKEVLKWNGCGFMACMWRNALLMTVLCKSASQGHVLSQSHSRVQTAVLSQRMLPRFSSHHNSQGPIS